jgi:GDSL-like Lipase/Acylhydrolase family
VAEVRREHVALLGDSILDNGAYTGREPDVITHLRQLLPKGWRATLCAVDGATATGVAGQLPRVPPDATQLVVAVGGNDALRNIDLLSLRVSSSAEVLMTFAERISRFDRDYRAALAAVLALRRPTTLCTIYNGALPRDEGRVARVALTVFNDVILRAAFDNHLDVIDLRTVCTEASDYANPIEPSGEGGRKIALAIAEACGALEGRFAPARVWVADR